MCRGYQATSGARESALPAMCSALVRGLTGLTGRAGCPIYNADVDSHPSVSYSLVDGSSLPTGTVDGGHNKLGVDPQFMESVPSDWWEFPNTGGDLRLKAGSPAIDAGNYDGLWVATDRNGYPRVVGSAVDIGAYEWAWRAYLPLARR